MFTIMVAQTLCLWLGKLPFPHCVERSHISVERSYISVERNKKAVCKTDSPYLPLWVMFNQKFFLLV